MNPEQLFCPNIDCPSRGQVGQDNISVHSRKEKRCICSECEQTFATSKGTIFYRLRTEPQLVIWVIVLLAYGCPVQAVVKAFGFDERTVKSWWQRAGAHCEGVHNHVVGQSQLDLQQVQADEIKVKVQGGYQWLALAIMVPTKLWLAGVISSRRDKTLIRELAGRIAAVALCRPLLLAVDGLPSYVKAFQRAFRTPLPRFGQPGRSQLVSWPDIAIVQVVKQRTAAGLDIQRRIVQGCPKQVARLLQVTQKVVGVINTAYIERLNATLRLRSGQALSLPPFLADPAHPHPGPATRDAHGRHVHRWLLLQSLRFSSQPPPPSLGRPPWLQVGSAHAGYGRCLDRPSMDSR
jgi:transposase-like protein